MRKHLKLQKPHGKLTARQAAFCTEYLKDLNATAAARRAGFSAKSASRLAIALLQKHHVLARIEELQAERVARMKVDADFVLRRLTEEIDAKVEDLYDADGVMLHPSQWPAPWQRGLVTHIQTTELYGPRDPKTGKMTVIGHLKDVVLADRVKRLELLGRHIAVQAFRERVVVGVDAPLRALFDQISGQSIRPAIENRERWGENGREPLEIEYQNREEG
jgi:phage terminase small subunit